MNLLEQACGEGQVIHVGQKYIPTGEFRDPNRGEYFIDSSGTTVIGPAAGEDGGWGHRIILRLVGIDPLPRREACHGIRAAIDNIADSLIAIKDQLRKIDDS